MSKSRGNVVGAAEMAEKYGCDTGRLYTLFAAPPEKDLEWSESAIDGCSRFLHRVFRLVDRHAARMERSSRRRGGCAGTWQSVREGKGHPAEGASGLRRVTQDFEVRWHFNSAIALMMELVNTLHEQEPLEDGARPEVVKAAWRYFF